MMQTRTRRPAYGGRRHTRWLRTVGALVVAAALVAAGCGRVTGDPTSPEDDTFTIGMTVYNMTSFITLGQQGVERQAEAEDVEVLWRSANDDVNNQVTHLQTFINQRVDAIVIAPVNAATLLPQVQAADEAGIPVFTTNLTLDEPANDHVTAYIGPDDVAAGEQAMRYIAEELDGEGEVVLLQGPLGSSGEIDRTEGVENALEEYPDVELLAKQTANWGRNEAYNVMNNWLSGFGGRIDAVVSENDDMAIGAIRALANRNLAGELPVVGVDGIQDGLQMIRDDKIWATNLQNAQLELALAIAVVAKHLRGEEYPEEALLDMPLVTEENVESVHEELYARADEYLVDLPKLVEWSLQEREYGRQSLDESIEELDVRAATR